MEVSFDGSQRAAVGERGSRRFSRQGRQSRPLSGDDNRMFIEGVLWIVPMFLRASVARAMVAGRGGSWLGAETPRGSKFKPRQSIT